ncbi:DUF3558 domain-containing protein [Saccharothrix algeriensis]|uniref:DUF3558 domain-containing protein n=1 Tax=Saccharothrix algeriensis TaxID=173560 RepID=A0A8T8HRH0_9PSEU|nr:DUF3558 domain-containing protein [Saccharothrix algeriensis]MBM7812422.1 hypothetical protein [Saccharothrix algeriensis]QTR01172.1 DUF3558 domain-containing protein [Saccharothrix algeriensis]
MRRAVPIIAAVLLLAGCSQTTTGSPTSGSTGTSDGTPGASPGTTASDRPGSTAKEPKKRPKTIDVEGVDPCTLLTEAQRAQFGADQPPQKSTVPELNWSVCYFNRGDHKYIVGATVITTDGIEFYTEGPKSAEAERLEVGGFPAVLVKATGRAPSCTVAVDVSDGQMVNANIGSFGETPVEELCRLAPQAAGAVVANLMAE